MIRQKSFYIFVFKGALFAGLLYLVLFLIGQLSVFSINKDPRKYLFSQDDFSVYSYAIIGDSVYCSYYVDSIEQTMWEKFEALTGQRCFPAALNGATISDMVQVSKYLGEVLPEESIVFIGLIPTRFVGKGIVRHQNYFNDFYLLSGSDNDSIIAAAFKRATDLLLDSQLFYRQPYAFENTLRNKKSAVYDQGSYSWKEKRDVAKKRYRGFVKASTVLEPHIDEVALQQIQDNLSIRNIQAVFVLSPLNSGLMEEFSSAEELNSVRDKLDDARAQLKTYLNRTGASYIDAYDKVDTDCFIDLVHINSCGDEVMAKLFADYIETSKAKR